LLKLLLRVEQGSRDTVSGAESERLNATRRRFDGVVLFVFGSPLFLGLGSLYECSSTESMADWKPQIDLQEILEEIADHASAHSDWLTQCGA
jgi:hypothetical protein